MHEYGVTTLKELPEGCMYDTVIVAVAHKQFNYDMIKSICNDKCVLFDVKSILEKRQVDARL